MYGLVPERITMDMSVNELAAIAAVFGKLNGHARSKLFLSNEDDIYGGATGILYSFFENGLDDIAPFRFELGSINSGEA